MSTVKNAKELGLREIAAWTYPELATSDKPEIVATLPALQRGAIWKTLQIEELWDSILRGFPIGAFLLSPFDKTRGQQPYKAQQTKSQHPTYHLLDGQQRTTAIALGFFDPWGDPELANEAQTVLWVDLGPPPAERDIEFVFRTVTRAHPWGYRRSDPSSRLSESAIRDALKAFRSASPALADERPMKMPLTDTWPWDAEAPIPFAWLVNAVIQASRPEKDFLWDLVKTLPLFAGHVSESDGPWKHQRDRLSAAFSQPNSTWSYRIEEIITLVKHWIGEAAYSIPMLMVPLQKQSTRARTGEDDRDPIETLFVRVNSAGTVLEGEELRYSLIKSAWIDAPDAVGKLAHRLTSPARIALLSTRLVLAKSQVDKKPVPERLSLIATPGVSEFRRLAWGLQKDNPNFLDELKAFVGGDGLTVFEQAREFLTVPPYGLPPVLAAELAQKAPDVFFLFLRWLHRMREFDVPLGELDEKKRRKTIGFLTALAWFAKEKSRAVDAVWHDLQKCERDQLPGFFSRTTFRKSCRLDGRGNLRMVPLIPPDMLGRALAKVITGYQGCTDTISKPDSAIWTKWNWWEWLILGIFEPRLQECHDSILAGLRPQEEAMVDGGASDRVRDAWYHFMETLWASRAVLLFAQREWIIKWFDFDPSLPELLEDKNRPWDYDHIHAQNYLQGRNGGALWYLPKVIKSWHGSIGNLRAWPLEANRALGDNSPMQKLDDISQHETRYSMASPEDVRAASFVTEKHWEDLWKSCVPEDKAAGYLANATYHEQRKVLVKAVIFRFLAIYRHWYRTLRLADLNEPTGQH